MVEIYLKNEEFSFIKYQDGEQVLRISEDHKVDLILLDIMMPGLNGMDAYIQIRERSKVPIIFMSAKSQDMDKIQAI